MQLIALMTCTEKTHMPAPINTFKKSLLGGETVIGCWLSLANSFSTEAMGSCGFDWLLVDSEHAPNDVRSLREQLIARDSSPSNAVVRIPIGETWIIKQVLDIGAQTILVPMVESADEARELVRACHYPPHGMRGVSGSTRANKFGRIKVYFAQIEQETSIILQLETQSAVALAEDIGTLDGVSGVFFGPADIAADMGLLGKPMDDAVWDLIMPAARALMAKGVPVGTLVLDPVFAAKLLNEGFTFVACGSDASILAKGSDALLANVKSSLD
jgi:4-hydroxy-2-oxoheptanedioate aldolase